ncbi:MAG TPA: TrpB-like pyridoxal phosphate-dependent enzyme [Solirubrobacterales bacterium]|jgi:tryptophan synthase beta chain|nr:TrpB-like pyridoxal phosphate-dependent enzyme [Solirubrobacterales bacterium]
MAETVKFTLPESEIPVSWVNLLADLPGGPPPPPLNPATGEPAGPDDLAPIFAMGLIQQEVSAEPEIEIPDEVREIYRLWRPTPLLRARRLERELETPAHIYYKYEGVSPAGSHKPNSAVPQAFYNREEGVRKLVTETGAGQWGSALALACELFGLECEVFMVGVSYDQKPYRRAMMETWGAMVHRSPSDLTEAGRKEAEFESGSLGIAISEAVEVAAGAEDTNYTLGSVLNHVCLHQTVVGQEAIRQMELAGEAPDVVVGCVGGGSNFAGIAYPFLRRNLRDGTSVRFLAAEPAAAPTLTRGRYAYDFGDTVGMTPLLPMYTLGHDFVPPPVHAGGLRYHGDSPTLSALVKEGHVEATAVQQTAAFEAAVRFARCEGIIPAPEPAHALRAAFDEAEAAKQAGEERVILVNVCGHGHFDMAAYDAYLRGELTDLEMPEGELEAALADLPQAPALS